MSNHDFHLNLGASQPKKSDFVDSNYEKDEYKDQGKEEIFSLKGIKEKINTLKGTVGSKEKDISKQIESLRATAKDVFGIPEYIISEYLELIKDRITNIKNLRDKDDVIKKKLGLRHLDINFRQGVIVFFIKKYCPDKYEDISNLLLNEPKILFYDLIFSGIIAGNDDDNNLLKDTMKFIENYGDLSYQILKYCSPFKGSYFFNSLSVIKFEDVDEGYKGLAMSIQFFENFINEPESINLFLYLMKNPQKLNNLGGKEIKEIDLNINSGINFAFRGIIEMVKSRPDLTFPHLKVGGESSDEKLWNQQRKNIIVEYEKMLRTYIMEDSQDGKSNAGKEYQRTAFDKIFFTTDYGDNVLGGIPKDWVNYYTGNSISDYSYYSKKNINQKKANREIVDNGYLSLTDKGDLNVNGTGIEEEYNSLNYSEKLFFKVGLKKIEKEGYEYSVEFGNITRKKIVKNYIEVLPKDEIFMFGKWREKNLINIGENMGNVLLLSDIKEYLKEHPNEKVLLCVEHHGSSDGSSCNGWSRDDRKEIANISPNLKIWSIRCHFGKALDDKNIYNSKSPVSGFSNNSATWALVGDIVDSASKKGLGFHEMEIYTRLNYLGSVAPLSEDIEYTNLTTGNVEVGKVGLAQNDTGESGDSNKFA